MSSKCLTCGHSIRWNTGEMEQHGTGKCDNRDQRAGVGKARPAMRRPAASPDRRLAEIGRLEREARRTADPEMSRYYATEARRLRREMRTS